MNDVDHTNPHTDESFGGAFRRGPDVAADGGERGAANGRVTDESGSGGRKTDVRAGGNPGSERTADDAGTDETDGNPIDGNAAMGDVDHEPPNDGAKRTFERGTEERDESA